MSRAQGMMGTLGPTVTAIAIFLSSASIKLEKKQLYLLNFKVPLFKSVTTPQQQGLILVFALP